MELGHSGKQTNHLCDAGRLCMEEISSSVQLLLRTKGHRSHPDIRILLHCDSTVRHGP
jgi:hypothetical protein